MQKGLWPYEIVKRLEEKNQDKLLDRVHGGVKNGKRRRGRYIKYLK